MKTQMELEKTEMKTPIEIEDCGADIYLCLSNKAQVLSRQYPELSFIHIASGFVFRNGVYLEIYDLKNNDIVV